MYRGSFFGVIWTLVLPVSTALIYFFVFNNIIPRGEGVEIDFFAYVFSGVLVVGLFTSSVLFGLDVVSHNSQTLRSMNLPLLVFQIIGSLSRWLNSLFALIVLFLYALATGMELHWNIIFAPFVLISISMLALPFSLLLCYFESVFKDLKFIVPQLTTLLIFLTPVFYLPSVLPDRLENFLLFNPIRPYLDVIRSIFGVQVEPVNLIALFSWIGISIVTTTLIAPWLERRKSDVVFRI